ncbi:MAG: ankyrin repeat domain-containing protein [Pirellulaceae bacterium]|nr:ankyrin repeat domain-containing protein [Pirellulaceae bacterium]
MVDIRGTARQFGGNDFSRFAVSDRRLEVAALLVKVGMDPNAKNGDQGSAIQIAETRGDDELADLPRKMAKLMP